jgi:hypothetical protein
MGEPIKSFIKWQIHAKAQNRWRWSLLKANKQRHSPGTLTEGEGRINTIDLLIKRKKQISITKRT